MTGAEPEATKDDPNAHAERAAELKLAMPRWIEASSGLAYAPARNPSLPTLVGLLILILCFFVVLTSISLRDHSREKSVLASLERTFSGGGEAAPAAEPAPEQQAKRMLGDLRAKLTPEVPLVSGATPVAGDELVLKLPRNLVFAGDQAALASGVVPLLGQVKAALRNGPADFAYEVEIVITAPQIDDNAVAEGAAVAGALRDAGFANQAAIVSLAQGSRDTVALVVRLRPNARLENQQ
ncbi:MAG TPA: hypothetical protein VMT54_20165 [Candidatus Cybelea sp.]|nr:hypothetical protein [Candidatus Cybelea sp.]